MISKMKKHLNKSLPIDVERTVVNKRSKSHQQSNIVYYNKYPYETCTEDYVDSDTNM